MMQPRNRARTTARRDRRSTCGPLLGRLLAVGSILALAAPAVALPGAGPRQQGQEQQQQAAEQPAPEAADLNGGGYIDRVLARVNGEAILQSDLEEQWQYLQPGLQGLPEEQLRAQEPEIRKAMLAQMADNLLIMQRAEEMGITASTNQIDRAISRVMQQQGWSTEEELQEAMAAEGMTLQELREQFADQIVRSTIIGQEIQQQLFVSQGELERFYEENVEQFTRPAEVTLQQAVFVVQGDDTAGALQAARETAEQALAELRAGASLAAIADSYPGAQIPDEPSDWLQLQDLRPEIASAVESLPIGDYALVETPLSVHIVQVINRTDRRVQPFEEVSEEIRNTLMREKEQQAMDEYAARLRESAYLEVMAPEYRSLAEDWENAGATSVAGERR